MALLFIVLVGMCDTGIHATKLQIITLNITYKMQC